MFFLLSQHKYCKCVHSVKSQRRTRSRVGRRWIVINTVSLSVSLTHSFFSPPPFFSSHFLLAFFSFLSFFSPPFIVHSCSISVAILLFFSHTHSSHPLSLTLVPSPFHFHSSFGPTTAQSILSSPSLLRIRGLCSSNRECEHHHHLPSGTPINSSWTWSQHCKQTTLAHDNDDRTYPWVETTNRSSSPSPFLCPSPLPPCFLRQCQAYRFVIITIIILWITTCYSKRKPSFPPIDLDPQERHPCRRTFVMQIRL